MSPFSRVLVLVLVSFFLASLASPDASGALERPVYSSGDRWTYVLTSDLDQLPGPENATQVDAVLQLDARLDVEVVGDGEVQVGGNTVPTVVVKTSLKGFLDGTVMVTQDAVPLIVETTGAIAMNGTEEWEREGYWPVASRGSTAFDFDVTFLVTTTISVDSVFDVLSAVAYDRTFPLDVGDTVDVSFDANTTVATTTDVLGRKTTQEATYTTTSTVHRRVVSTEEVSVEAGTFDTYRFDQDIAPAGGLGPLGFPLGTNETAFFAPSAGNYVRRDLYANGTQVAEVTLRSFSSGGILEPYIVGLLGGGAVVAVAVAALWYRRRRKRGTQPPSPPSHPGGGEP